MKAYPVKKALRRERFAQVMAGLRDYTALELDGELLDLHSTYLAMKDDQKNSGLIGTDTFLKNLRIRSENLRKE